MDTVNFPNESSLKPDVGTRSSSGSWMHTISSSEDWEHALVCYVLTENLRRAADDYLAVATKGTFEIPLGLDRSTQTMVEGRAVFGWKGTLVDMELDDGPIRHSVVFRANREPAGFMGWYRKTLKERNPLRGRFLSLSSGSSGLSDLLRPWPDVRIEDVVLDPAKRDDLVGESINVVLEHFPGPRGGTGFGGKLADFPAPLESPCLIRWTAPPACFRVWNWPGRSTPKDSHPWSQVPLRGMLLRKMSSNRSRK